MTDEDQARSCGYVIPGHGGEVEDYRIVVTECPRWDFVCDGCINLPDLAVFASRGMDSPCIDPARSSTSSLKSLLFYVWGIFNILIIRLKNLDKKEGTVNNSIRWSNGICRRQEKSLKYETDLSDSR